MKKSKEIALAGISTALASVFLVIGSFFPPLDLTCFLIASFAIALPLYKHFVVGAVLSYIASGIIMVLVSGNIFAGLPFFIWFGLHPIFNYFQFKFNIPKLRATLIKVVIFSISFFFIYKFSTLFVYDGILDKIPYIVIGLVAAALFFVYDRVFVMLHLRLNYIISKIIKN